VNIQDIEWVDEFVTIPYPPTAPAAIVLYQDFETWPLYLVIRRSTYDVPVGFEEIIGPEQVDEVRILYNDREYLRTAIQTKTGLYYGNKDVDQLTEEEADQFPLSYGPIQTIGFLEDYDFPPDP
jgi:hypothetical protein